MSSPRPTCRLAFAALILGLGISGPSLAGDLNPPAGPVAPTQKPLSEVEPRRLINAANTPGDADSVFRIAQPGSYYLGANITGASGKHGIKISASPVTIDLNGFTLSGVPGSLSGVTVSGAQSGATILNGHVVEWGQRGIDLTNSQGGRVEGVTARINTTDGIVTGPGTVVTGSVAIANGNRGFDIGADGLIESSVSRANQNIGLFLTSARADNCLVISNLSTGIQMQSGSSITSCTSRLNSGDGIQGGSGGRIFNCQVTENGGSGITGPAQVEGCVTNSNAGRGIYLTGPSHLSGSVVNCVSSANGWHGIQVGSNAIVRGNLCASNGTGLANGAGIRIDSEGCRVEGNNLYNNDIGISVTGTVNIVLGNTCRGNTAGNFDIVANNRVGVIIVPPLSGVISGNSGAAGLGSTDPTANYAY